MGIFLAAAATLTGIVLAAAYVCCQLAFSVPRAKTTDPYRLPVGEQYDRLQEKIRALIDQAVSRPWEDVYITSEDGLRLHGRYYETTPGAPVELLLHGYRSNALLDFCGGLDQARRAGHNALLVDQRAHGTSEGRYLSFGIWERRDCLSWIQYLSSRFDPSTDILLIGVSMGAATVLMAAGLPLPGNVRGIIADSGYTSPEAIIRKVLKDRRYPQRLVYPLLSLGTRLYCGFRLEACSATEALQACRVPVLLVHGEADHFVPSSMSRENYAACASEKLLLTVPGAGHGLSCLVDWNAYDDAVHRFYRMAGLV